MIVVVIFGLLEGLIEFIFVFLIGYLLLVGYFLGFDLFGCVFEVLIQVGVILVIFGVYVMCLWQIFLIVGSDLCLCWFIFVVLVVFLFVVIIGVMVYGIIKNILFEMFMLVVVMLIIGGFILLWVDCMDIILCYYVVEDILVGIVFKIGLIQCLVMIFGVLWLGLIIMGVLFLGVDKCVVVEFSFFLFMLIMLGVFCYDFYKNKDILDVVVLGNIVVGFIGVFILVVIVVCWLLNYVLVYGYVFFVWW